MEQEEKRLDETVPGGRYIVNGQTVNANGEPLKEEKAKPVAKPQEPAPAPNDTPQGEPDPN